ncbi:DUF3182 family protein [Pseudomonas borbori]
MSSSAQSGKSAVVLLPVREHMTEHEDHVQHTLGIKLAKLLGCPFSGVREESARQENLYYIPTDTLIGEANYRELGIQAAEDFFGGWVSQPFMATKAITHPLFGAVQHAPPGWSTTFAEQAGDAILAGYTVFDLNDAVDAAEALLQRGPLRVKPVRATAGRGQEVIACIEQLKNVIAQMDAEEVATWGLVLEENLHEVSTYSVGQVTVAGITISYYGTQCLTEDNTGDSVYGGSELVVVRGDYDALLALELPDPIKLAVAQAQTYERAAVAAFPGFVASRRNYDIAQGVDAQGQQRSGVLEQSWRIGGASGAEILALEAMAEDPSLNCIRASTHELYGADAKPPLHAIMLYQGNDPDVGPITKFALVEPYVA